MTESNVICLVMVTVVSFFLLILIDGILERKVNKEISLAAIEKWNGNGGHLLNINENIATRNDKKSNSPHFTHLPHSVRAYNSLIEGSS